MNLPSWFRGTGLASLALLLAACQRPGTDPPSAEEEARLLELGRSVSKVLADTLGAQLKSALQAGGPVPALQVCQQMAGPLTESAAQGFPGATVRRVTLRPRRPANAADPTDRKMLEQFAATEADLRPAETTVWTADSGRYYKPLLIQEVCLTCHGNPDAFSPDLSATLRELYPDDLATGYAVGDLRGAIRVDLPR